MSHNLQGIGFHLPIRLHSIRATLCLLLAFALLAVQAPASPRRGMLQQWIPGALHTKLAPAPGHTGVSFVQAGTNTITLQQGVNGYAGAQSVDFTEFRYQGVSQTTHYYRYDGLNRYYNLEFFNLGDMSAWTSITSAQLIFYKVGGSVFSPSKIYVRRINDPDRQGSAYPTGWKVASSDGYRNGANKEDRDHTVIPHVKWKASDPTSSGDTETDYFQNVLQPLTASPSFTPSDADPVGTAYVMDVTSDVECFRSGVCPNQGWATWHESIAANIQNLVGNSKYSNPNLRPKLVVTYTTGLPVISSFSVSPSTISAGSSTTLSWSVANATSVQIDQNIGTVNSSGSRTVSPTVNTTYTLTATNSAGTSTATVTVMVTPASPHTYYVATNGNDTNGNGSIGSPWQTVQKCVNVAVAGDVCDIRGGTYTQTVNMVRSGTAGNPITIQGHPGETVIFDGTGQDANLFNNDQYNYLTFQDLRFTNWPANRFVWVGWYNTTNITVQNIIGNGGGETVKIGANGIDGSADWVIKNVVVTNALGPFVDAGPGSIKNLTVQDCYWQGPTSGNNTAVDGIAVENGTSDGSVLIQRNTLRGGEGDGIDLKAWNATVDRNEVRGHGRNGIKIWRGGTVTISNNFVGPNRTGLCNFSVAGGNYIDAAGSYSISGNVILATAGVPPIQDYIIQLGVDCAGCTTNLANVTFNNNTFHSDYNNGVLMMAYDNVRLQSASNGNTYSSPRQDTIWAGSVKNSSGVPISFLVTPAMLNNPPSLWTNHIGGELASRFNSRIPVSPARNHQVVFNGSTQYGTVTLPSVSPLTAVAGWQEEIIYRGLRQNFTSDQIVAQMAGLWKLVWTGTGNAAGANKFQLYVDRDSTSVAKVTHIPTLANLQNGIVRVIFDPINARYRIETEEIGYTGITGTNGTTANTGNFNFGGLGFTLGAGTNGVSPAGIKIDQVHLTQTLASAPNTLALWTFDTDDGRLDTPNQYSAGLTFLGSPTFETVNPLDGTPVVWTNAVGVSVSGNNLTKTAASGWGNAGASSTKAIASGDGYVEFTATETNSSRMCGLSKGDTNQTWQDIDYAIYVASDDTIEIFEAGVYRGDFGTYAAGDRFRVAVEGGVVKYRKNGALLYTSTVAPIYPLLVDTALAHTGATLTNVVIYGTLTP